MTAGIAISNNPLYVLDAAGNTCEFPNSEEDGSFAFEYTHDDRPLEEQQFIWKNPYGLVNFSN
ncbi:MAG: hypothetical protein HQM14_01420 [SAR324 cluster bacterium]|nr:hypothetical protein [SAR324 cluster bacterium]